MDAVDTEARAERGVPLFEPQPGATAPVGPRAVPVGYYIEKPAFGYRFTVAGEHRSKDEREWRPTLRWAKAAARRRLRQARAGTTERSTRIEIDTGPTDLVFPVATSTVEPTTTPGDQPTAGLDHIARRRDT